MLIYASCKQEWLERGPTLNFIVDFLRELAEFSYIEKTDIYLVLLVAVITTILRYIVTKSILVVRNYDLTRLFLVYQSLCLRPNQLMCYLP